MAHTKYLETFQILSSSVILFQQMAVALLKNHKIKILCTKVLSKTDPTKKNQNCKEYEGFLVDWLT